MSADSITSMRSANQSKDGGSIPASALHFTTAKLRDISLFVGMNHYSHTHPGGVDYCFAATSGFRVVGAAMFGYIAGNPKAMVVCNEVDDHHRYRELMRLVFTDECGKNSESMFIGFCLRWLKRNTELAAIVSFADPRYGHCGTVYQATNWLYTGIQKQDRDRIYIKERHLFGEDEREIHPKQAYNRFGSSARNAMGDCRFELREPKHRYVYLLRQGLTCKYPIQRWK
jgi:hypothetical protein